MNKTKNSFNIYFNNENLTTEVYSASVVKSLIRSILEPIATTNSNAVIFTHLNDYPETQGLIKRLEYSSNTIFKKISDFEFSKFDVEEVGFIVLNSQRYSAAFLFKEIEENKFQIYLKLNSKFVFDVYETLKNIFLINYDADFYEYKPERRDNTLMNDAVFNIIKHFEEFFLSSRLIL